MCSMWFNGHRGREDRKRVSFGIYSGVTDTPYTSDMTGHDSSSGIASDDQSASRSPGNSQSSPTYSSTGSQSEMTFLQQQRHPHWRPQRHSGSRPHPHDQRIRNLYANQVDLDQDKNVQRVQYPSGDGHQCSAAPDSGCRTRNCSQRLFGYHETDLDDPSSDCSWCLNQSGSPSPVDPRLRCGATAANYCYSGLNCSRVPSPLSSNHIHSGSNYSRTPPPRLPPNSNYSGSKSSSRTPSPLVANHMCPGSSYVGTPSPLPANQTHSGIRCPRNSPPLSPTVLDRDLQHRLSVSAFNKPFQTFCFDVLPDDILFRIFCHLSSDQLCRCARVCRRWYDATWDPALWTFIRISNPSVHVDRGLKILTRRLSCETPGVCALVDRIDLSGCQRLTDKGLLLIARQCTELRQLTVQGCPRISNIALFEVVSNCVNLEHLNVAGCPDITCVCLTPEATLQTASYGKQVYLGYLDMSDCEQLQDSGLQIITAYCNRLSHLYLRRCPLVTDLGVQCVANYCPGLREFSVSDCPNVTDKALYELARLGTNLRYLSVAKCDRVTDAGLGHLARACPKLRYLNVRGCEGVSNLGVELVAKHCQRLKSLDIGKCDVTDGCLERLGGHCPQLRKLSVKGCELVTDAGVVSLSRHCRLLQQLNIQECNVSADACRIVKRNCRHCVIEHTNPGFS